MYMLEKGRYVVELTVREILKRSHFKNTNIAAGNNGLDRKVKWVHIVEIETFGHLLNGKEMILSTGVEWANDTGKSLFYLQQLLDFNASALCIELIGDNQSPPLEMRSEERRVGKECRAGWWKCHWKKRIVNNGRREGEEQI